MDITEIQKFTEFDKKSGNGYWYFANNSIFFLKSTLLLDIFDWSILMIY